jgi:hypothetical protein
MSLVELLDELRDGVIEIGQAEEPAIADPGEDPTLGDQYASLDLSFCLWAFWAGPEGSRRRSAGRTRETYD